MEIRWRASSGLQVSQADESLANSALFGSALYFERDRDGGEAIRDVEGLACA
jgi:hypothetical protein